MGISFMVIKPWIATATPQWSGSTLTQQESSLSERCTNVPWQNRLIQMPIASHYTVQKWVAGVAQATPLLHKLKIGPNVSAFCAETFSTTARPLLSDQWPLHLL